MDYARALVEHPRWRWEPGMRASYGIATEIVDYGDGAPDVRCDSGAGGWDWSQHHTLDINHPATKGWLLHMLREATGTQLSTHYDAREEIGDYWYVSGGYSAPTEGEALAAALLAVWGRVSGCNAILAACPLYVACVDVRAANAALDAAREDGRNDSAQAEACNDADAALHALLNATELGPDAPAEILCAIENAVKAAWDDGYGDGLDDGMAK